MKKVLIKLLIIVIIFAIIVLGINLYVILTAKKDIIDIETAKSLEDVDCIIVLGASIVGNRPSLMLEDRLITGIEAYENGIAPKIIVSGDHGTEEYDEVNVMKQYVVEKGIESENVFMDHAGFSTYDSIYRAKEIFKAKKIVIVTQEYHLYRAVYIAKQLGLEAYGIPCEHKIYANQSFREIREILARNKDFVKCIFKPEATYLGDTISVNGDGDITNDK